MKFSKVALFSFFIVAIVVILLSASSAGAASFSIGDKLVVDIINDLILVILSYMGKIALFVLMFGGILYVVSGSNPQSQEKAKKTIIFAILGLMLVLISYAFLGVLDSIFAQP